MAVVESEQSGPEGPEVTAGEYALGMLEGAELAAAQRQFLSDPEFAEMVEWWRSRLAAMAEAAGIFEPSPDVWPAIARRLGDHAVEGGAPQSITQPVRGLSGWNLGLALGAAGAVAAAITVLIGQPAQAPLVAPTETAAPLTGERLVAQLEGADGALVLTGLIDMRSGELAINMAGFQPASGQATELWVVPDGGAPQSLGLVPASGTFERPLTAAERASLVEGALLAVTYEDAAGAPHEAPTTDILLIGGLTRI